MVKQPVKKYFKKKNSLQLDALSLPVDHRKAKLPFNGHR